MKEHYQVVVIGGGTGGLTIAARLCNLSAPPSVAIIEPSEKHYYQPLWTLVGGGVFTREETERDEADYIPLGATWVKDAVATFAPDENYVVTAGGKKIYYDYLVVAAGIKLLWDGIKGLKESVGKNGVCSNYSYETVNSTWESLRNFKGGTAIFTMPDAPIKCGGAPQKIAYLVEDYLRKNGLRDKSTVIFASAKAGIFGVEKYKVALEKVIARKEMETRFRHELIEVVADKKEAIFKHLDTEELITIPYDMIHVTPPQGAPDFIKNSPLAAEEGGWLDLDMHTLQHTRYPNVFGAGDCANLPTARTGAAVRKQAPVVVANLMAHRNGEKLSKRYNGYSSCPLVTGYDSLILAEFDYDGNPDESFPFNQAKERYSMYVLKAYGLPKMYWHGMLRGRA